MEDDLMITIAKPIMGKEEEKAVISVLRSGNLTQGKVVEEFEQSFANFIGTKYAIATSSGTASLYLSLLAHGITKGIEVIVPSFSFIATAYAVTYTGAKAIFADIDPNTFNLDPKDVEKKISKKTKAIIVVHLYGLPADLSAFQKIVKKHQLILIEDACQAHGATFLNKRVGSFGTGCFSFYPTKNMTTGEGGMVTTNNHQIAEKIRLLRNQGMKIRYYHEILGYNLRMTNLAASIGLIQLKRLNKLTQKRVANANFLTKKLSGFITTPKVLPNSTHVFHQYTVRIPKVRDKIKEDLSRNGIQSEIYYPIPIHKQRIYKNGLILPVSELAADEVLSLPIHPSLTKSDLVLITKTLIKILKKYDLEK